MAFLTALAALALVVAHPAQASQGDGLSEMAGPDQGGTEPTLYGMQRRLASTQSGRLLGLYVPHMGGPQLAWRDPGGTWETDTTGDSSNGRLLAGAAPGVNPASIVVGPDADGIEHAWVVFGGGSPASTTPVYLRRLSDLDSPAGPRVGPLLVLSSRGSKPDIELVTTPQGPRRAVVVWSEMLANGSYRLVAGWVDDLGTDTPALVEQTTIATSATDKLWATLASSADGTIRAIARVAGRIVSIAHQPGMPASEWAQSADGTSAAGYGFHSAVTLDSGETLVAVESNIVNHIVKVQRFGADDVPAPVELSLSGYSSPTLATDGTDAWLVMIRLSDGLVVSRQLTAGSAWSAEDRVEIGAEGGGDYGFPNLMRRVDTRLRLLVRGPEGATSYQHSVLAYQRPVAAVPDGDEDGIPDDVDTCPATANPDQTDTDSDGQGDACDSFPNDPDNDADGDGVSGELDNCASDANPSQANNDGDADGDACDPDDDNDGTPDTTDAFPLDGEEDTDTDSDTVGDNSDNCPTQLGAASNAGCPVPVDSEVDAEVEVDHEQEQSGSKIKVKLGAICHEACMVAGAGTIKIRFAGNRNAATRVLELRPLHRQLAAGQSTVLKLKPKGEMNAKKVAKAIEVGAKAKAQVSVEVTDASGNATIQRHAIRLV